MKVLVRIVFNVIAPLGLLAGAIVLALTLMATKPQAARVTEERLAPVVQVVPLEAESLRRVVTAHGTVVPARQVSVSSEVTGRVLEIHPALQPGGVIAEGELLIRIDPEEYALALAQAEAALSEATAALEVEQGRQRVAEREWELFGRDMPDSEFGRQLALREPQLHQAQARIESAQSEVARAKLDLKRTEIRAPFDATVLRETVDVGQRVGTNDEIAVLVGTDVFWVQVSVPVSQTAAIMEASTKAGAPVRIYSETYSRTEPAAVGTLLRLLPDLETSGRMAQVLIEVPDPLALDRDDTQGVALPLNSYVRTEIDAGTIENVIRVPRDGLRENGELWVADAEDRLRVRQAEVVWSQDNAVAVRNGFEPGDRLIVSPLDNALPNMELRPRETNAPEDAAP